MSSQLAEDNDGDSSRRLSARPRKLTAKAQALSGSRFLPRESANIPLSTRSADSHPASPSSVISDLVVQSRRLATLPHEPASSVRSGSTYSRSDLDPRTSIGSEAGIDRINNMDESPRRSSKRGPKPRSETPTSLRKRPGPPSEDEPRYKMRVKRKPTAKALDMDTKLDKSLDEHLDEMLDTGLDPPKEGRRRSPQQKSTNGMEMNVPDSRSRRSLPAKGDKVPPISDPVGVKTNKKVTRKEENHVVLPGSGHFKRSQKRSASPGITEPSAERAGRSPASSVSSQAQQKHPKQQTKGSRRAASAPAHPSKGDSKIQDSCADSRRGPKDHPKHGKQDIRKEKAMHETNSLPTRDRLKVCGNTHAQGTAEPDVEEDQQPPSSQERLILTLPLPSSSSSSAKRSTSFPAQVRKAEFVDKGCQLFCLDPSSRILAFAEIAADLPEYDEDEKDDAGGGAGGTNSKLYEKWLELGRARFCVCGKPGAPAAPIRSVLTEDELARFLEPNGVTPLKAKDDEEEEDGQEDNGSRGDDNDTRTSGVELPRIALPRVNTIVKASEGRRVSALYNQIIVGSSASSRQSVAQSPQASGATAPPAECSSASASRRQAEQKESSTTFGIYGPGVNDQGEPLPEDRKLPGQVLVTF